MGNKKDSFNAALDEVFRVYNQNGYTIAVIHANREFKPLLQSLEDDKSVKLNLAAANELVPEIERTNRMFKECLRACYHSLPYKNRHRALLLAMVEDCAYKTNFFPVKVGLSQYYSPWTLVEQKQLNYNLHLLHSFGEYVQAPQETTNTPVPRMLDCIYLSLAYNTQGGYILFNLHTKSLIVRHYVISIPILPSIIDLVNDMGKADGMTHINSGLSTRS